MGESANPSGLKPINFLPPLAALVIAGAWLATQHHSVSIFETESALLRRHIAAHHTASTTAAPAETVGLAGEEGKSRTPIDWKTVSAQLIETQRSNGMGDMRLMIRMQQRVAEMTQEELVAALDEIAALDLPAESRSVLEQMLMGPLMEKNPALALTRFFPRFQEDQKGMGWQLATALGQWADKDPREAGAWFDQQIAAGKFDSKTLDGRNRARLLFESEMIRSLVGSDAKAADARLAALPEDQWTEVLRSPAANGVKEQDQKAFAVLVRGRLPDPEKNSAIAQIASNLTMKGYPAVSGYLDRIAATPEERVTSARSAASMQMTQDAHKGTITREGIDTMREWVTAQAPGTADATTGKALADATGVFNGKFKFADAAALVLQYQASSGNDDVLVSFLDSGQARRNKEEAIELAEKIADPARREEILSKFE